MAVTKKKPDTSWVHSAAGLACQFSAQDADRPVSVDYTTILGTLPVEEGEAPAYVVRVDGTETESRGEYSWGFTEHWTVTRKPDGTPEVDEATEGQIKQVGEGS